MTKYLLFNKDQKPPGMTANSYCAPGLSPKDQQGERKVWKEAGGKSEEPARAKLDPWPREVTHIGYWKRRWRAQGFC